MRGPGGDLPLDRLDFGIGENDYKAPGRRDDDIATSARSLAGLQARAGLRESARRAVDAARTARSAGRRA